MSTATIYGNLQGLKPNQLKQLQKLYHQRIRSDRLTTTELAERIAAISTELKKPVSVYLNRRGQVIRVGVGTPRQTQYLLRIASLWGREALRDSLFNHFFDIPSTQ